MFSSFGTKLISLFRYYNCGVDGIMAVIKNISISTLAISLLLAFSIPVPISAAEGNTINVLIAYDEEFDEHGYWHYVYPSGFYITSTENYIEWQLSRAFYHIEAAFGEYIHFEVLQPYIKWDSDDSLYIDEMLLEAEVETGFADGTYPDGTILICFTFQADPIDTGIAGGCIAENRSMIIRHQEEWADDNVIMHEICHLWIEGHCQNECVMSYAEVTMFLYNEPLAPEFGFITLFIGQKALWSYFSYEWCPSCHAIMENHLSHEYPPPPDPWIKSLDENDPIFQIWRTFWIVLFVTLIIIFAYLIWKNRKKNKLLKNNKSSINFLNIAYLMRIQNLLETLSKISMHRNQWIPPEKRINPKKQQFFWRKK